LPSHVYLIFNVCLLANNHSYTEKELFNLIATGNEAAFRQLYVTLKPVLFGYIFKLTKSQEAVREIVQESMFRLWIGRDKLPEIAHPRAWLLKLVSNECLRYFRKNGLQKRLMGALQQQDTDGLSDDTEMELSYRETRRLIESAVATLSPRQREIFRLSRDNGLRIPEIAAQLGLSESYVKKTLILALHSIRQQLIKAGKYMPILLIWLISYFFSRQ